MCTVLSADGKDSNVLFRLWSGTENYEAEDAGVPCWPLSRFPEYGLGLYSVGRCDINS